MTTARNTSVETAICQQQQGGTFYGESSSAQDRGAHNRSGDGERVLEPQCIGTSLLWGLSTCPQFVGTYSSTGPLLRKLRLKVSA